MYDIILGRSEEDKAKFGTKGAVYIGKQYVKMGRSTSLANKVYLDIATSHVIFVAGKRGSGKCLHGDTLVTLDNGIQLPIKDLANDKNKIFGLDHRLKIAPNEKQGFYEREVNELLHLKLRSGKEIKITPEHPLLKIDGWTPAYELKIGDRIATPKKNNERSNIYEVIDAFNIKNNNHSLNQIQIPITKERMELLVQSDIFWDEIISIENLFGVFKVYDISVPEIHNFIANDIIVHNSYTMGVIAEGVADLPPEIKENVSVIMLDTMGIYWTMKYENKKDEILLGEWDLKSKPLDIKIYTPTGFFNSFKESGIPTDFPFAIKPSDLDAVDWCTIFEIKLTEPIGVLIERTINLLKEKKTEYGIDDIIKLMKADEQTDPHMIFAAENRFVNAKMWGLFDKKGTPLKELVKPGQITILDVSCYVTAPGASGIRALVIGLVAKKLFLERMVARRIEEFQEVYEAVHYFSEEKKLTKFPLVWLVIDEAHEFLPNKGKTVASLPLITILREGRQPGISLILASQQPGKIHTDVMTQADITISHVITARIDTDALANLTQSYMRESLDKQFSILPKSKGSAVVLDDMNERIYPIKVRPRFTWHGGAAPSALREPKKIFDV